MFYGLNHRGHQPLAFPAFAVPGNATATAANITAAQFAYLFRLMAKPVNIVRQALAEIIGPCMQPKDHWESTYASKAINAVSWFQEHAEISLRLIQDTGVPLSASIIDVGGGASTLVDDLLSRGYSALTVLDLSGIALSAAKARLGGLAGRVTWLEANITAVQLPPNAFDVWHDRAVFHFLNSEGERRAYLEAAHHSVKPGGHVIVATFAEDGPVKCSGLPVVRYSAHGLQSEFGPHFTLLHHEREEHHTPMGTAQKFVYCHFRKAIA